MSASCTPWSSTSSSLGCSRIQSNIAVAVDTVHVAVRVQEARRRFYCKFKFVVKSKAQLAFKYLAHAVAATRSLPSSHSTRHRQAVVSRRQRHTVARVRPQLASKSKSQLEGCEPIFGCNFLENEESHRVCGRIIRGRRRAVATCRCAHGQFLQFSACLFDFARRPQRGRALHALFKNISALDVLKLPTFQIVIVPFRKSVSIPVYLQYQRVTPNEIANTIYIMHPHSDDGKNFKRQYRKYIADGESLSRIA